MRTHQGIVAAIVIGLIGVPLPCRAGVLSTGYPERSVEELKLMTTPELASEARGSCLDIVSSLEFAQKYSAQGKQFHDARFHDNAIKQYERVATDRRYMERIGLVIRERHHGEMPSWFEAIAASKTKEDCDTAATAGGWRPKQ
jgi:hypothetical protein